MNILINAGLSDFKLKTKLYGLVDNDKIDRIYLLRKNPITFNDNNKIVNINPQTEIFKISFLFEFWKFFHLFGIFSRNNIDLLYAIQLVPHSFLLFIFSKILKKGLVLSVIGDDILIYIHKPVIRNILKIIINQASVITILGDQSLVNLLQCGFAKEKIKLVYEYVNADKFTPKIKNKKEWDFIFVGDLIPVKSVSILIDAFALAAKKLPDIKLCIVGTGQELNKLVNLTNEYGLESRIDFVGKTDHVENYLNNSKVFVMSSQSEGLPAASVEAIFCGLPVILPDVGDIPGFFSNKINSLIFSRNNTNQLAQCLTGIIQDKQLYYQLKKGALELRKNHLNECGREALKDRWKKLLEEIENGKF